MNAVNDWVQRLLAEIGEMTPLQQLLGGLLLLIIIVGAITIDFAH